MSAVVVAAVLVVASHGRLGLAVATTITQGATQEATTPTTTLTTTLFKGSAVSQGGNTKAPNIKGATVTSSATIKIMSVSAGVVNNNNNNKNGQAASGGGNTRLPVMSSGGTTLPVGGSKVTVTLAGSTRSPAVSTLLLQSTVGYSRPSVAAVSSSSNYSSRGPVNTTWVVPAVAAESEKKAVTSDKR
jgi:hypothetical protein